MRVLLLSASLMVMASAAALSQPTPNSARPGNDVGTGMSLPKGYRASNLAPQDTRTAIAPNLPAPQGDEDQLPSGFLKAAQSALAAGRTGQAQQALEMAQTRLLDRSVPIGQTNNPSDNPSVRQTSQALQALAAHDRGTCMQLIEAAIGSTSAQGL